MAHWSASSPMVDLCELPRDVAIGPEGEIDNSLDRPVGTRE